MLADVGIGAEAEVDFSPGIPVRIEEIRYPSGDQIMIQADLDPISAWSLSDFVSILREKALSLVLEQDPDTEHPDTVWALDQIRLAPIDYQKYEESEVMTDDLGSWIEVPASPAWKEALQVGGRPGACLRWAVYFSVTRKPSASRRLLFV